MSETHLTKELPESITVQSTNLCLSAEANFPLSRFQNAKQDQVSSWDNCRSPVDVQSLHWNSVFLHRWSLHFAVKSHGGETGWCHRPWSIWSSKGLFLSCAWEMWEGVCNASTTCGNAELNRERDFFFAQTLIYRCSVLQKRIFTSLETTIIIPAFFLLPSSLPLLVLIRTVFLCVSCAEKNCSLESAGESEKKYWESAWTGISVVNVRVPSWAPRASVPNRPIVVCLGCKHMAVDKRQVSWEKSTH